MKKKYVKPTIFIESFELNQHIAACVPHVTVKVNSSSKDSCPADLTQNTPSGPLTLENVFNVTPTCVIEFNEYCYTTSASDNFVFNS